MKVRVAISKKTSVKEMAAAAIIHDEMLGWMTVGYVVGDGKVVPFGGSARLPSFEKAVAGVCSSLGVTPDEIVEIEDTELEDYIRKNAIHKVRPSRRQPAPDV